MQTRVLSPDGSPSIADACKFMQNLKIIADHPHNVLVHDFHFHFADNNIFNWRHRQSKVKSLVVFCWFDWKIKIANDYESDDKVCRVEETPEWNFVWQKITCFRLMDWFCRDLIHYLVWQMVARVASSSCSSVDQYVGDIEDLRINHFRGQHKHLDACWNLPTM